jgi:hypothetical protein
MAICIPKKPLSRRTLLRGVAGGAAITVGLPRFAAMLNGNGTAYAQGAALPKRFGVWFWGNGMIASRWIPKTTGTGAAWQLSEELMPFAKVKQNLTVLTGYDVKLTGTVHRIGPAAALSGAPHNAALNYTAPTIDHVISQLIGGTTSFRSLEVGVSRATANGDGQTVNYASSSGPNAPVQPEYDARAVYARLFGMPATGTSAPTAATAARTLKRRAHVLDTVAEDAKALRLRLGVDDARRLDQHLEGIQQLEKRITAMSTPTTGPAMACGPSAESVAKYPMPLADLNGLVAPEQNEAMAELVTYALTCDLTRVFLFQHGRPAAHYNMSVIGITKNIHDDISHQEAGDQPIMNTAILYWMDQFRVLMEKMQAVPEGAGNLLQNSAVYATSDIAFGRTHSVEEMPALIFGRAGGVLKGDQHVRAAKDNISKILFTLVNAFGGNVTQFGVGAGMVTSGIPDILA